MVGVVSRVAAVLALVAGAAACSSAGTVTATGTASAGPLQDLHLDGDAVAMHWTDAAGHLGVVHAGLGGTSGTGCFGWADPDGVTHWAARLAGVANGHQVQLVLAVDGQAVPPLGRHATIGADGSDGMATLTVDGVASPAVHDDPADTVGPYFLLDGDGTTGRVRIRFAAFAGGPQTWLVQGRWRCA